MFVAEMLERPLLQYNERGEMTSWPLIGRWMTRLPFVLICFDSPSKQKPSDPEGLRHSGVRLQSRTSCRARTTGVTRNPPLPSAIAFHSTTLNSD
eukprot:1171702-Prorocentrum_minimum.AAC.5